MFIFCIFNELLTYLEKDESQEVVNDLIHINSPKNVIDYIARTCFDLHKLSFITFYSSILNISCRS